MNHARMASPALCAGKDSGRGVVHPRQSGMTLMELLLAVLLASFVMVALVRFVDVSLGMWSKSENERAKHGRVSVLLDRMVRDLETTHPGQLGDLLVEWVPFDLDGDSAADRFFPRIRIIRRPSSADWRRLGYQEMTDTERLQLNEMGFGIGSPAEAEGLETPALLRDQASGLVEVMWALMPQTKTKMDTSGVLLRAEQRLTEDRSLSFFRESLARAGPYLQSEPLEALSDGILWLELEMLTGATRIPSTVGLGPEHSRLAWDALGQGRADSESAPQNRTAVETPLKPGRPVLPSRVRISIELERLVDVQRRPRLVGALDREETGFTVTRGESLPRANGGYIRVGAEWMLLTGRDGDTVTVVRGQRSTLPSLHESDAVIHFGKHAERVVELSTARQEPRLFGGASE